MTLTRAQWGARSPKDAPIRVAPASRTGVAVHHDGATPITVRTLADVVALIRRDQSFHMDTRGWNDIGYNWLVISAPGCPAIDGLKVEGRGRDVVGAHCEGHNTEWVGIQIATGGDQEASPAALRSARELHEDLERAAGHAMARHTHSDGFNTECPGAFLTRWVRAGMPAPTTASPAPAAPEPALEDVMSELILTNPLTKGKASAGTGFNSIWAYSVLTFQAVKAMAAKVGVDVDEAELAKQLAATLGPQLREAITATIAANAGASPDQIADAVVARIGAALTQ